MSKRARQLFLAGLLAAAGGGVDACKIEECLRHTDCPRTQSCELGACVSPPTPDDGSPDAGESSGGRGGSSNARGGASATRGGASNSSSAGETSAAGDNGS